MATAFQPSAFQQTAFQQYGGTGVAECVATSFLVTDGFALTRRGQVTFAYDAWDNSIYGPKVIVAPDGTWRMYYTAYEALYASWRICVATSSDRGGTWVKPSLGQFTYAGNTNNNICLQIGGINLQFSDIMLDPNSGLYVMTVRNDTTGTGLLYSSSDGFTFAFVSTPMTGATGAANGGFEAHPDLHVEIKTLTWNPVAGKYRAWYAHRHFTPVGGNRTIGYYDCATLAGTWVNRGPISTFTSTATTLQYYDLSTFEYNGALWGVVNMFNNTTQVLSPLRLYRSADNGDTWCRAEDLFERPAPGSWDYGLVTDATPILVDGVWYLYYGGKAGLHNDTSQITLGLASTYVKVTGAGKPSRHKRKTKYVTRHKGEDRFFESIADLEEFIDAIKQSEKETPKRYRAPIKITLSPDFIEEITPGVEYPRRLEFMPASVAMIQIKRLDLTLSKLLADAQRVANEEDEELCLLCLLS